MTKSCQFFVKWICFITNSLHFYCHCQPSQSQNHCSLNAEKNFPDFQRPLVFPSTRSSHPSSINVLKADMIHLYCITFLFPLNKKYIYLYHWKVHQENFSMCISCSILKFLSFSLFSNLSHGRLLFPLHLKYHTLSYVSVWGFFVC